MPYSAPIALLTELKARLNLGDTVDDAVLSEMLLAVSGAIEAAAGRKLRRDHCTRERFAGGGDLIRVSNAPIAAVHWVRESYDRNFADADAYDELVEGEDYVLEAGAAGESPGESGWIRRLHGAFLGSPEQPAMIEVCYTGGYKTPGEQALENSTLTIDGSTNTSLIDAFSVTRRYLNSVHDGYLAQYLAATECKAGVEISGNVTKIHRAALVFRLGNVLIPTWEVVEATLALKMYRADGTGMLALDGFVLPYDPRAHLTNLGALYDAIGNLSSGQVLNDQASTAASGSPDTVTIAVHSDAAYLCAANLLLLNQVLRRGFLAFAFKNSTENITLGTSLAAGLMTPRHATAASRPALTLVHRDTLNDPYVMPDDLKHATLIQTAQDWQVRRSPGFRQETQRGVSVASGVSYLRDPATLLPEVLAIAQRYARFV